MTMGLRENNKNKNSRPWPSFEEIVGIIVDFFRSLGRWLLSSAEISRVWTITGDHS